MATVKPILRTAKARSDGHAPIWLRFSDTSRSVYAATGVYVHPRFWNENRAEVRKGHPHAKRINGLVARRLAEVEDERLRLLTEREPVTAETLRAAIRPPEAAPEAGCLIAYERRFIETLRAQGNVGTVLRNGVVMNKLEAFLEAQGGGGALPFTDVTPGLLRDFEAYLIGTKMNKASTARGNMKVIRTAWRRARREGLFAPERDPWDAFSPARESKPERGRLTLEQIDALAGLDLGPSGAGASLEARTRDAFMLALYAAGMRFGDVCRLRVRSVVGRQKGEMRVVYTMGKTKKRADVRLVPQAERIVRAYLVDASGEPKPDAAFLFGMLDAAEITTPRAEWGAVGSENAKVNKVLKRLATRAGIESNLTFHIARHSFSDLARRSGWSIYDVSKALAHSSLAQTERYMAGFDAAGLDAKMDGLFGGDDA